MLASPLLALLLAAPGPSTAAEDFFVGRTVGKGTLHIVGRRSRWVRDRGHGHLDPSGALIFVQEIEQEGEDPRRRSWRLVRSGSRLTGTISDAVGPVTGEIKGRVLRFRYRNRKPSLDVEQTITIDPNGRIATNHMVFRKPVLFGAAKVRVATMESTIRKVD